MANRAAEKRLTRLKGLSTRMREGEQPLFSVPAIWENVSAKQTEACDLVLTNQRVFGYIYTTFPRERLFLDALELEQIKTVSVRQKNFDTIFRELLISNGQKRILVRATRSKIEETFTALREAIGERPLVSDETSEEQLTQRDPEKSSVGRSASIYERKTFRQPAERSTQNLAFIFSAGLLLEAIGFGAWVFTGSLQIVIPLFLAGIVAVVVAILARRQLRR